MFCYNAIIVSYNSQKIEDITGKRHRTVNHSVEYKTAEGIHTNVVEGTNNALKCKFFINFFMFHIVYLVSILCFLFK